MGAMASLSIVISKSSLSFIFHNAEVERLANNLVFLERESLCHMSSPFEFYERVAMWVAEFPVYIAGHRPLV